MKKVYAVVIEYFDVDENQRKNHLLDKFVGDIFSDFESAVAYAEEREYVQEIGFEKYDHDSWVWLSKDKIDYDDDEVLIYQAHIEERVYSF
jgi:hypothetical protein